MGKTVIAGQIARSFRTRAVIVAMLAVFLGSIVASPGLAAAPSNDDFDGAASITAVPFTTSLDIRDATSAADDPDCSGPGHTVWYSFTPAESGTVMANTAGSDFDSLIGVYTGSRGSLNEVVCNDDVGPGVNVLSAYVQFPASVGTTYYFMVGTPFSLDASTLSLTVDEKSCPGSTENAGFENGDFANWTTTLASGAAADVAPFHGGDKGTVYTAQEGACFARLSNDYDGGFTSISRVVALGNNQVITGEAALDSYGEPGDTSYNDIARVRIYDTEDNLVAEPLVLDTATMAFHADRPWTTWSFTAASAGSYRLAFEAVGGPLGGSHSIGLFDEPDTITPPTFTLTATKSGAGTLTSDPAGIDCGSDCTEAYNQGTSVILTASASTDWVFGGWGGACSGTGTCSLAMTTDRSVSATFNPVLNVTKTGMGSGTVQSNDGGINCGIVCSKDYVAGTEVELNAVAAAGSVFGGWSGGCTGSGSCTLNMDGPESVTASFEAITTLNYTGAQIVDVGSALVLTAKLSGAVTCLSGKTITFQLNDDPTTAALDGPFAVASGTTDAGGVAQATAPTAGWHEGAYAVTARFAPSGGCGGSSTDASLAVAETGTAANGGGWYSTSDVPRVNFAFTVRALPNSKPAGHTGKVLLVDGRWRLEGTINDYSNAAGGNKAATGAGDLFYWDASTKSWASSGPATFTLTFRDGAQGSGKKPDLFGVQINHMVWSPPEPSSLPNSSPQAIKAGNVRIN